MSSFGANFIAVRKINSKLYHIKKCSFDFRKKKSAKNVVKLTLGGPHYMWYFYLQFCACAMENCFFLGNLSFYSGVSNSNVLEGHIPKKKASAGRSLLEKRFCGPQFTRKVLKMS
jgi:hypothetical protein